MDRRCMGTRSNLYYADQKSRFYDEDFTKLANYMTKNEKTREKRSDGSKGKPRLKETSYNHAKNMPLPEPKSQKLVRWQKEVKTQKRLLHRKQLRGDQPGYGDEIPQIHTDQNPQENLK